MYSADTCGQVDPLSPLHARAYTPITGGCVRICPQMVLDVQAKVEKMSKSLTAEDERWISRMVDESLKHLRRQGATEAQMAAPRKKLREIFALIATKTRRERNSAA